VADTTNYGNEKGARYCVNPHPYASQGVDDSEMSRERPMEEVLFLLHSNLPQKLRFFSTVKIRAVFTSIGYQLSDDEFAQYAAQAKK